MANYLPANPDIENHDQVREIHDALIFIGVAFDTKSEDYENRVYGKYSREVVRIFEEENGLRYENNGAFNQITGNLVNAKMYNLKSASPEKTIELFLILKQSGFNVSKNILSKGEIDLPMAETIRAFQHRMFIPGTGYPDKKTENAIRSFTNRPFPEYLQYKPKTSLKRITHSLDFSSTGKQVRRLHISLAALGYMIEMPEYNSTYYGKSTIEAVKMLQRAAQIGIDGRMNTRTSVVLSNALDNKIPGIIDKKTTYRVRGSIRDEQFKPLAKHIVEVYHNKFLEEPILMGTRETFKDGFFDIVYSPYLDNEGNVDIKNNSLIIKVKADENTVLTEQVLFNIKPVHYFNFTVGHSRKTYLGKDLYRILTGKLLYLRDVRTLEQDALIWFTELREDHTEGITILAKKTEIEINTLMKLFLAFRISQRLNNEQSQVPGVQYLSPAIVFALIFAGNTILPENILPDRGDDWDVWRDEMELLIIRNMALLSSSTLSEILNASLRDHIIGITYEPVLALIADTVIPELAEWVLLDQPLDIQSGVTLGAVFDNAQVQESLKPQLSKGFIENQGFTESFWDLANNILPSATYEKLLVNTEYGSLVGYDGHNTTVITSKLVQNKVENAYKIAGLSREQWRDIILTEGMHIPEYPAGEEAPVDRFANDLFQNTTRQFPSLSFVSNLKGDGSSGLPELKEIQDLLKARPKFNLLSEDLDTFFTEISASEELKEQLFLVQRVQNYTPYGTDGDILLQNKFHSAAQIVNFRRDTFITKMHGQGMQKDTASGIFRQAEYNYAKLLSFFSEFSPQTNQTPLAVLPDYAVQPAQDGMVMRNFNTTNAIPNLESLFGSLDSCACGECQSVVGASAYLVDLMRFLESRIAKPSDPLATQTVKEVILARRPDLDYVELSCANTDTPVPYVDIVCEVLENAVAYIDTFPNPAPDPELAYNHQTRLSAKELRAFPEYLNKTAYNRLLNQLYPVHSPIFNLWQETTRLYLAHLGSPWWKLMQVWQKQTDIEAFSPSNSTIAAEYFGFSSLEADIIRGYSDINQTIVLLSNVWNIDFFGTLPTSVAVEWFLQKTGLSYDELLLFLQTDYIQYPPQDDRMKIVYLLENQISDPCSTDVQQIDNLSFERYNRIQRFLRLWHHTDWTMLELDMLLSNSRTAPTVETDDPINDLTLYHLMQFSIMQKELKLEADELLTFWGVVNYKNYTTIDGEIQSLYTRLFLNLSFVNPIADDFYDLAYHPEIEPTPPNFTPERIKLLSAALAYSETEVRKMLVHFAGSETVHAEDAPFTLDAIGYVYRHVTLTGKLKINFNEFLTYRDTTGSFPFSNIAATKLAIEQIRFMQTVEKDFSVWEYILTSDPENTHILDAERLDKMLLELRTAISSAVDELESINSPERSDREQAALLFQRLPQFQNLGQVQLAIDFVEGRSISTPPIFPDPENTRRDFFDEFFTPFIPKSEWGTAFGIFAQSQTELPAALIEERYNYLFSHLRNYALQLSYSQVISRQVGIDEDSLAVLLQDILITAQWQDMSLVAVLYDGQSDLIAKDSNGGYVYPISDPRFDYTRTVYNLLHKIAALLDFLPDLTSDELGRYIAYQRQLDQNYPGGNPPIVGITNLATLLTPAGQSSSYKRLENWIKLERIRAKLTDKTDEFFELLNDAISLGSVPILDIAGLLASIFDEPVDTMLSVLTQLNFNRRHFTNAASWQRIKDCIDNYALLGVDVADIVSWLNKNNDATTGETISNDVVKASKAKYSLDTWLTVIEPYQDTLREKKRDALVSFLVEYSLRHNQPTVPLAPPATLPAYPNILYWTNPNDLYAYFLLDVEMSPCQLTSRIRQASLSVQVFVQRCFLGLEKLHVEVPNVNAGPDDTNNWNQWQWMKYYRVWDASRRIFLYPENWIEPDLRPDMSPFFRELTDELSQGDITDERAEEVLINYLDKVQEVANLDIASVYHEKEPGIDVFHVLGRTKANPFNYYYRTFNQITRLWTAWDKISADITGSHPLLTKYNGKVYLFWLLFEEKTDKLKKIPAAKMTTAPQDAPDVPKMFEIRLSWIRRRSDGWTEKRVSNEKMIHPWGRPKYSYNLRPRLKTLDNTLWIDLYISTSAEFNQPVTFYNQKTGTFNHIAKAQFNESFRPWHSSSFVFNGAVKELRLRKMYGNFLAFSGSNSYDYVNRNFEEAGRAIKQLSTDVQSKINLPWGMHFEYTYLTNNIRNNINTLKFDTLQAGNPVSLLRKASPPFRMAVSLQDAQINNGISRPFFYQDPIRSFFIRPRYLDEVNWNNAVNNNMPFIAPYRYEFNNFYHPYAQVFIQELNKSGLLGLYNRRLQIAPGSTEFYPGNNFSFNPTYDPNLAIVNVTENAQSDKVDFSYSGAYSIYNWELFFHVPFYIANKLSQNQRFEEAMKWYKYIFDPTSSDNYPEPKRFWITKPFFQMTDSDYRDSRINAILSDISEYSGQVAAWRNDPHNPHLVALSRPVAYQKAIVMKFIDNLLAWGDYLFRADTMETVQEASTLYLLAYQILGKKPEKVPAIEGQHLTLKEIFDPANEIDEFGGASLTLENYLINYTGSSTYESPELPISYTDMDSSLMLQYFCIPDNPKLISYWALVEDRLFKLRHCMNIDGIVRQLPLFEPPIDPALLVRARAQGLSIASVLFNMNTPSPNYRFRTILQKAIEYCGEVRSLGERLLSIIERLDAENLAVLRSTHELNLLDLLTESKELQIDEFDENIINLEKALEITEARLEYYRSIPKINAEEKMAETLQNTAMGQDMASGVLSTIAGSMVLIPAISAGLAGAGGSPTFSSTLISGTTLAGALNAAATAIQISSGVNKTRSSMLLTKGGYTRRDEENKFQIQQAEREIQQINIQLTAAKIRKQIAEKDLRDHTTRLEYSQAELEFMKNKFSNAALYNWMLSQITTTYFQAYQFAHDMALKAEACYKFELGIQNTSFIDYGYWDNLRKGLLAGDKLGQSLRRLEASYFDQNKRELEITKNISLAQYFPNEFFELKTTGRCNLSIEEWLYDLDYPGHYKRRIKTVSITAPCVTGPYTSVNCKLSMSSSTIRSTMDRTSNNNTYKEYAAQNQIVTSSAQGDSGMFQMNLGDERFLPFEGAGVFGDWEILLPIETNQFDFSTLSDFILTIQYTAMEGDGAAQAAAQAVVDEMLENDSVLLLNLRQMFAAEWYKILAPENTGNNSMNLNISNELFPFLFRNKDLKFSSMDLYIDTQQSINVVMEGPHNTIVMWDPPVQDGPMIHYSSNELSVPGADNKGIWKLTLNSDGTPLTAEQLHNAYLIINFTKN